MRKLIASTVLLVCLHTSYAQQATHTPFVQEGIASFYADKLHGSYTAHGEQYDVETHTAAHAKLPLHTMVKVTNLENSKSVVVRINDRLPSTNSKAILLSRAAASEISMISRGSIKVKIEEIVDSPEAKPQQVEITKKETVAPVVAAPVGTAPVGTAPVGTVPATKPTTAPTTPTEVTTIYRTHTVATPVPAPVPVPTATTSTKAASVMPLSLEARMQPNFTYDCNGNARNPKGYCVQVAALSSLKAFSELCSELELKGSDKESLYIHVSENEKGVRIYRLLVGSYEKEEWAREKLKSLADAGYKAVVKLHQGK
jgi:rare lipoprotein A